MRMPRVRFREFLLLTTLASLVAASLAIRTRVAHREAAHEHATRAYRIRQNLGWWEGHIARAEAQAKAAKTAADRVTWQALLRDFRGGHAKAIAEVEHHERVARSYEP